MADAIEYQKLVVKVVADTSEITGDLKSFNTSLKRLEKLANNLDFSKIDELQKHLQKIAKIDFSNVSQGLQDIVSAFKAFSSKTLTKGFEKNIDKKLKTSYPLGSGQVTLPQQGVLDNISFNSSQVELYRKRLEDSILVTRDLQLASINAKIDVDKLFEPPQEKTFTDKLKEIGLNGKQIKEVFASINYETDKFDAPSLERLEKLLKEIGYDSEEVDKIMKRLKKDVEEVDKKAEKASTNGLKKLITQFTRIMRYRVMRKVIQEIYKALTEGLQALAQFDEATNNSLSKITSAYTYLKNAIGAMLSPLVQIIEPIISSFTIMIGDLANAFAEFFASVNGQDMFAKAKYDLKDYQEQLKKTQTLSIDELNIINADDKSDMFTHEEVQLGEKEASLASTLKDLFAEIKEILSGVLGVFKDFINKMLPSIINLLKPVFNIVKMIAELLFQFVDETFEDVHESLAEFTNLVADIFKNVEVILRDFMPELKNIVSIISVLLNLINVSFGSTFNMLGKTFKILSPIISALNLIVLPILNTILTIVCIIFTVVEGIVKSLVDLVTFNWDDLGNVWADVGKGIKSAWDNLTVGTEEQYAGFASDYLGYEGSGANAVIATGVETQDVGQALSAGGQDIVINLDGQQIAKVVTKRQNNFGADLVAGGNIAWGK